ncbi:MAG: hypothetical protein IPP94_19995 [Ignavibacteria bacterium]|nr:hypothetical protein [Ignavibacteria bacterium]
MHMSGAEKLRLDVVQQDARGFVVASEEVVAHGAGRHALEEMRVEIGAVHARGADSGEGADRQRDARSVRVIDLARVQEINQPWFLPRLEQRPEMRRRDDEAPARHHGCRDRLQDLVATREVDADAEDRDRARAHGITVWVGKRKSGERHAVAAS